MDAPASLTEREVEYFLRFVERSLTVRNRSQFFLWVRGELQALLPHALLICAKREREALRWKVSPVAEVPYPPELLRELRAVEGGLPGRMMEACRAADGAPVLACPALDGSGYLRFRADLERFGLDNFAAHGLLAVGGDVVRCFGFIGIPPPLTARHAYLLQILVPYLHAAFVRTSIEEERAGPGEDGPPPLTRREVEVLGAVQQGLSNAAIARDLGVSPLTVKNHVQRRRVVTRMRSPPCRQTDSLVAAARLTARASGPRVLRRTSSGNEAVQADPNGLKFDWQPPQERHIGGRDVAPVR